MRTYSHKKGTMNEVIYEDMREDLLTTQQLLERATFFEDPRRAARLRELERQASAAKDWTQPGPARAAARKRAHRSFRRKTNRLSFRRANRSPCSNLNSTQHSEGFLPPTGWSWTRPGLFPDAAPLTLTPRTRGTGRPAGPGLPNGNVTGDDD